MHVRIHILICFFKQFFREAIEEIIALETESGEIVSYPKLINVLENIQRSKKYKVLLPELEERLPFRVLEKSFLERKQVKNIPRYSETLLARKFYRDLMWRRKQNCSEFESVFSKDVKEILSMDVFRSRGCLNILNKMIEKGELETTIDKIEVAKAENMSQG